MLNALVEAAVLAPASQALAARYRTEGEAGRRAEREAEAQVRALQAERDAAAAEQARREREAEAAVGHP